MKAVTTAHGLPDVSNENSFPVNISSPCNSYHWRCCVLSHCWMTGEIVLLDANGLCPGYSLSTGRKISRQVIPPPKPYYFNEHTGGTYNRVIVTFHSLAIPRFSGILDPMAFGVFIHRTDSIYDDVPSEQYQFPKQYLSRAQQCEGDWIVYLEPRKVRNTKGYFAIAKVREIIADPRNADMYVAVIEPGTYLDFGDPVPFRDRNFIVEQGLLNDGGKISGRAQAAVRPLSPTDFARIIERGLGQDSDVLPRTDHGAPSGGFQEEYVPFEHLPLRKRVDQLTNRIVRDRNFRKNVLRVYGERCAITGLRLINGGGRAEVEAAHIRPVEHDGPDMVSNGLALAATAHWMFDRGLVGLTDDLTILISRQSNDQEAIMGLINKSGKLLAPERLADRPRPEFLAWHRENCFKH